MTARDAAHQLAYRLADAILAPWPAWADPLDGGAAWRAKTHPVGAISRFDDRPPVTVLPSLDGRRRVLVLSGRGGTGLTADDARCGGGGDARLGMDRARPAR